MKRSLCAGLLLAFNAMAETLTIERIFAEPSLAGPTLRNPKLSPDGKRVTFLKEKDTDARQLDLWEYNVAAGETRMLVDSKQLQPDEEILSDEEKARRERQRIAGLKGIVAYQWAKDGKGLLFPLGGDLHFYDLERREPRQLTATESFETDPQISPLANYVGFIRDQDLYVAKIAGGGEKRLTHDGGGTTKNGMAEFVAQEEMDRDTGYWWSPDEAHIAFLQVDESPVAVTQRYEIYAEEFKVIDQRYPSAGTPNVRVRLGVVTVEDGSIQWVDLGDEPDIYVPRVDWARPELLTFQVQSRDQKRLELRAFDLDTGEQRPLLSESAETWVNLHHDLTFLESSPRFIWSSERNGYRHLYVYDFDGELVRALTAGDLAGGRIGRYR